MHCFIQLFLVGEVDVAKNGPRVVSYWRHCGCWDLCWRSVRKRMVEWKSNFAVSEKGREKFNGEKASEDVVRRCAEGRG